MKSYPEEYDEIAIIDVGEIRTSSDMEQ